MTEAALDARTNLLGLTRPELEAFVASLAQRAEQTKEPRRP